MAVAFKTALGTQVATTSGNTLVITTTAAIAVNDLVVVRWAGDNLSATTPTATCADSGSNTYSVHQQLAANATAALGIAGGIMATKATTAIAAGGTITVTYSGSVAARAAYAESFTGCNNTTRVAVVGATGTTGAVSPGATAVGITTGDLVLTWAAYEDRTAPTGDSDTLNGSWSTLFNLTNAATGTAATRVETCGQYKIVTAGGAQTWSITGTSTDCCGGVVVLQVTPVTLITQAAYRWYDEGTETGAVALAAQDTLHSGDVTIADGIGQLRVRLQTTNAVAGAGTDDWQLQWEKNASGSWTNVTTGGTTARGYNSPNLTDAAATTSRLTGGTGTFVAGKISETGLVSDLGWSASNYTELLFSLDIVNTDVVNGDTLRFRVLKNGATTDMTYAVTPTLVAVKTVWTGGSTADIGAAGQSGAFSVPGGAAATYTERVDAQSATSFGSGGYTPAAFTPTAGNYLVVIASSMSDAGAIDTGAVMTISDSQSMAWTKIGDVGDAAAWGIGVAAWISAAVPASTSTTITIDAGANFIYDYFVWCAEIAGGDGTTAGYVEDTTAVLDGAETLTLAAPPTADDVCIGASFIDCDNALTPTAGSGASLVLSRSDPGGGGDAAVVVNDALASTSFALFTDRRTTANGTYKGVSMAFIVKAAGGGGPGPQTWTGSTADMGAAGQSGAFVGGAVTWIGTDALIGMAGQTGALVGEAVSWVGTDALIGVAGQTGAFTTVTLGTDRYLESAATRITEGGEQRYFESAVAGPQTWTGSTGTIGAAGQSGAFTAGAITWAGTDALIGVAGQTGAFVAGVATWAGTNALMGVAGQSGAFVGGAVSWASTNAAIGAAGQSGTFVASAVTWVGTTNAAMGAAGQSGTLVGGAVTWVGSTADIGAAGTSGAFVAGGGPQTWVGTDALMGAAGQSAAFAAGAVTWTGSTATAGAAGQSGTFVSVNTIVGSTATMGAAGQSGTFAAGAISWTATSAVTFGIAGQSGTFTPGTATWAGSTATIGMAYQPGAFSSVVTWAGSTATVGAEAQSGAFVPGTATWVGSTATMGAAGQSGLFTSLVTWIGSTADAGVAGQSGTMVGGATTWVGTTAFIGIAATSGQFVSGSLWTSTQAFIGVAGQSGSFVGAAITWTGGSTATFGIAGQSGLFTYAWPGTTATIGAAGQSGAFLLAQTWVGSTATIGAAGQAGSFSSGALGWTGSTADIGLTGQSGVFVPGTTVWVGTTATIGLAGQPGLFVPGVRVWAGSIATMGAAGQSGAFSTGITVWVGSTAQIGPAGQSGLFLGGAAVWFSVSVAMVGAAGRTGSWIVGAVPIYGWINGQETTALQWGDQPVVDFLLTEPVPG